MYLSIIDIDTSACPIRRIASQTGFDETLDGNTHKILLKALHLSQRTDGDLTYRRDGNRLCVYHSGVLDQLVLMSNNYFLKHQVDMDEIFDRMQIGDVLRVYLKTTPYYKPPRQNRKNTAKRHYKTTNERVGWVKNKIENNGIVLVSDIEGKATIVERKGPEISIKHFENQLNTGNFTLQTYDYIVDIQIADKEKFIDLIKHGIGLYKSYGCGMILIGAI